MKPVTVLIVDDSVLIRKLFTELLSEDEGITVIGTATDAQDAREKIKQFNPQVLTLDIEMPGMDGLSFLEKIMTLRPMPVIMASTLTQKGASETIRALELGAIDYISKPTGTQTRQALMQLKEDLVSKVHIAAKANLGTRQHTVSNSPVLAFNPPVTAGNHIIAIGSSTGGVEALRDIFQMLPANCPPIVMTQHMPEQFTRSFSERLNQISQTQVSEAVDGAKLKPGYAYLAPGNHHMTVVKRGADFFCKLSDGERVSGHRPSVDVLFNSVAETIGNRALGIILTGMGKDGAQGLLKMREAGAYTIGQNQASCVVYGMPKAAMASGAVQIELTLKDIPVYMLAYCEQARSSRNAS